MSVNNLHLKMFSIISGCSYDDKISERANKEIILGHYGLLSCNTTTIKKEFNTKDIYSIGEFLQEQCQNNRYCSILVHTGRNETIGGCNVIYIINSEDIAPCLNLLEEKGEVTIYSRQKSTKVALSKFDNYEQKEVGFGGGFRIQVNGINSLQEHPTLTLLVTMSFDNFGSRVLSETVTVNSGPPIKSIFYEAPIIDGRIAMDLKYKNSFDSINKAEDAVLFVIECLLRNNIAKIDHFLRNLLELRPAIGVHQLEGMYGVTDNGIPIIEIIDFDGLDVFDIGRSSYDIDLPPQELFFCQQLESIGFLKRGDTNAFSRYLMQESEITECISMLNNVDNLPRQIKSIIIKLDNESLDSYFNRLKPYIYASKALRWVDSLKYVDIVTEICKYAKYDNNVCFYLLSIAGTDMMFLLSRGELSYFESESQAKDIITHIFGPKILPVYFSYAREGD